MYWCIGGGRLVAAKGVAKLEAGATNLGYWGSPGSPPTRARETPQRHAGLMHVPGATGKLPRALVQVQVAIRGDTEAATPFLPCQTSATHVEYA
jgi:hypothetical protein